MYIHFCLSAVFLSYALTNMQFKSGIGCGQVFPVWVTRNARLSNSETDPTVERYYCIVP